MYMYNIIYIYAQYALMEQTRIIHNLQPQIIQNSYIPELYRSNIYRNPP